MDGDIPGGRSGPLYGVDGLAAHRITRFAIQLAASGSAGRGIADVLQLPALPFDTSPP